MNFHPKKRHWVILVGIILAIIIGVGIAKIPQPILDDSTPETPTSSAIPTLEYDAVVEEQIGVAVNHLVSDPETYVSSIIIEDAGGSPFPDTVSFKLVEKSLTQHTDADAQVQAYEIIDGVEGDKLNLYFVFNPEVGGWQLVGLDLAS